MPSRWIRVWTLAVCASLAAGSGGSVVADATPAPASAPLDLAAMTLDASQLPPGLTWLSEGYRDVSMLIPDAAGDDAARAVAELPVVAAYSSSYTGSPRAISMLVIEYESVAAVESGFTALEDEAVTRPVGAELIDEPALPDVGQSPGEVTVGLIPSDRGREVGLREVTFRVDRLLVRLTVTRRDGGTADIELTRTTAAAIAARVESVLRGDVPDGADPGLRDATIRPINGRDFIEGYVTAADLYPDGSPATIGYDVGIIRSVSYSPKQTVAPPIVTLVVTRYADPKAAASVVARAEVVMPDFADVRKLDIDTFQGRPVAIFGFDTVFVSETGKASVRAYVAEGDLLIWIDVQGLPDESAALGATTTVLERQLDCEAGVPRTCGGLDLERTIAPAVAPAATPIREP